MLESLGIRPEHEDVYRELLSRSEAAAKALAGRSRRVPSSPRPSYSLRCRPRSGTGPRTSSRYWSPAWSKPM